MKLAFVLPNGSDSGGTRCTSVVAKALLGRGHEVRILYRHLQTLEDRLRSAWGRLLGAPNWLADFPGEVASFSALDKCSFRRDEVIIGVGMFMAYHVGLLDHLPNPKVQYFHGGPSWFGEMRERAFRMPVPKIVVASFLKEMIAAAGGGQVLAVVPNGVDFTTYYPALPEASRDGIGTMYGPLKDPATVSAAMQKVQEAHPDVPLRVFSSSRRPTGLPPCSYRRYPSPSQAREIYSRSLVWLLGSAEEGFGMPVLEAMACGCVVVATDCGGPSDIIVDGKTGFLVPVGDVPKIVERVLMLIDDAKLRERIRINSLEAVKQFSWGRCALQLESALQRVSA